MPIRRENHVRHTYKPTGVDELSGYDTFASCTRDDLEALVDASG
jgi:hypothetical protein